VNGHGEQDTDADWQSINSCPSMRLGKGFKKYKLNITA